MQHVLRFAFGVGIALFAGAMCAQEAPALEPVLVPVFTADAPGAFGSLWRTELSLMNAGTSSIAVKPLECQFVCGGLVSYNAGTANTLMPFVRNPSRAGRFLWIEQSHIQDAKLSLRVRDLSRQAESAGIDVPIVRRAAVTDGAVVLLNIPTGAGFRHSLRIYDVNDEHSQATARVRIYPFPTDGAAAPLADFVVTLEDDPLAIRQPYRSVPAQALINNLVDDRPSLRGAPSVTIQVDPVSAGTRLWAFVSITNNTTQEFTTVTPQ